MDEYVITDISRIASDIQNGGVVGFPTGTSYGLAANACDRKALARVRAVKKRPEEKTFTVCTHESFLHHYFVISKEEQLFLEKYADSAVTILLEPKDDLLHLAQDGRVGLRIIDHPLMYKLAEAVSLPFTATSANVSGQPPCYTPQCVARMHVPVLDGGELPSGASSTIVHIMNGRIDIVRKGAVDVR